MAWTLLTDVFNGYLQYGIPVDRVLSIAQVVTNNTYTTLLQEWYVNGVRPRQAMQARGKKPVLAYVTNRIYHDLFREALAFIADNPVGQVPLRLISRSRPTLAKLDAAGLKTVDDFLGCTRHYLRAHVGLSDYEIRKVRDYLKHLGVEEPELLPGPKVSLIRNEKFWAIQEYVAHTGVTVDELYRLAGDSITPHVAELTKPIFIGDSQRSIAKKNGLVSASVNYYCTTACDALSEVAIPLHRNGGKYSRSMPISVLGPAAPYVKALGCVTVGDVVDLPAGQLEQMSGFGHTKRIRLQRKLREVTE